MPDNFFDFFPKIQYSIENDSRSREVTDLTKRFIIRDAVINTTSAFYTYSVKEGERPDHIANFFYQNPQLDWLVLMVNEIFDPFFEWPMGYYDFREFIKGKYGTVEAAHSEVHHYEQIVQEKNYLFDNTKIPERIVVVDKTAYDTLPESDRRSVSNYTYEQNRNEDRREIRVLQERYVQRLLKEARTVLNASE